jgi:tetratricopeptide (TPR) repeat protein
MMKRTLCSLLSFAVVGVQFCAPALTAYADSHLNEAKQAFSEKRFHAAEDLLNAALAKNPTDQEAHLFLARTYVQLLDNKAAEHEYTNCMKCNPFSPVGRMAHQETINIGGRSAADKARPSDDVKTVSKSVDEINREANDLKGGYGVQSHTMTPSYSQQASQSSLAADRASRAASHAAARAARKATRFSVAAVGQPGQSGLPGAPASLAPAPGVSSVNTQPGSYASGQDPRAAAHAAALARMAAHRASRDAARAARFSQNAAVRNLNSQNPASLMAPSATPSSMGVSNGSNQTYTSMPTNMQSNRQGPNLTNRPSGVRSYAASDPQVQRMYKQQQDAQHAQYTQDSANNLQRLMSEKQNPNSPKLRALGTNLFVRYYGSHDQDGSTPSAPGVDPVIEMKAKQMKFGDTK